VSSKVYIAVMRLTLLLFVLLISTHGLGQNRAKQAAIEATIEAKDHVRKLKEGVLLVRLQNRTKGLEVLRGKGLGDMADAKERELLEEHREIAQAFKDAFTFCPVYFFYSDQSQLLRDEDWQQLKIFNAELKEDTTVVLTGRNIYTAEFDKVQDESEGFYGRKELRNSEKGATNEPIKYTNQVSGFSALIIKDRQILQLKRPFPYYVKTFDSVFFRRSKFRSVQLMQENLMRFYKS